MPETEQKTFQKRQVAYKVGISDLLEGVFAKDDASAGYIKSGDLNISRVNVISMVVYKSEPGQNFPSCIVDDGTGKILIRAFENSSLFSGIDVGDFVLVIGRIREYNNEKYILPEIIKKLDNPSWMSLRKIEINNFPAIEKAEPSNKKPEAADEATVSGNLDVIYSLIKKLDAGEGAPIDDVIKNSGANDAEEIINRLLENGDIFEIKPGKVKVLE